MDQIKRRLVQDPGSTDAYASEAVLFAAPPDQLASLVRRASLIDPPGDAARARLATRLTRGRLLRRHVVGARNRTAEPNFGPLALAGDDYNNQQFLEIAGFEEFEPALRDLVLTLEPGRLFVDVGAYVGYFSLLAAHRGATALALEMQADLIPTIRRNAVLNGFWNLHTLHAAVSDRPGMARLWRIDPTVGTQLASGWSNYAVPPVHSLNHDCIVQTTLDQLLGDVTPDMVKIDAEGAEIAILRGARDLIARRSTIFAVEMHGPSSSKWFGDDPSELDTLFPADTWRRSDMDSFRIKFEPR